MKYCINCNHKVNDGDNYCTNCGEKIKWNTIQEYDDINNRVEKVKRLNLFDEELDRLVRKYEDFLNDAESYYSNNVCPYCGIQLEKKIVRATKCPECKNKIFKRTNMYNRNCLLLKDKDVLKFNKFDEEAREIKRQDRTYEYIMMYDNIYIDYFNKLKPKGDLSVRDILYSFCNYCASQYEIEALNIYQNAKDWNDAYSFKRAVEIALINWHVLYRICIENNKDEIAFDLLLMMSYKDMVSIIIHYELLDFIQGLNSTCLGFRYSDEIIKYLEENNLKLKDFKEIFLNNNYSFLIFDKPKELVWKYIEQEIREMIKHYKKYGHETNII